MRCPNPNCNFECRNWPVLKKHLKDSKQLSKACYRHAFVCQHCRELFLHMGYLKQHLMEDSRCNAMEKQSADSHMFTYGNLKRMREEINENANAMLNSNSRGLDSPELSEAAVRHFNPSYSQHLLDHAAINASRFTMLSENNQEEQIANSRRNILREGLSDGVAVPPEIMPDFDQNENLEEEPAHTIELNGSLLNTIHQLKYWDFTNGNNPLDQLIDLPAQVGPYGLEDLDNLQSELLKHQNQIHMSQVQTALLSLFQLVAKKGGNSLYQQIVEWALKYAKAINSLAVMGQAPDIKDIFHEELYGSSGHLFKPNTVAIKFSTGRKATLTKISPVGAITDLLMSRSSEDIASTTHNQDYYDELNSGTWWTTALNHECTQPQDHLEGLVAFVDSVAIDKYQKLSLIPVMISFASFKTEARRQEDNWRVIAYVDYKNQLKTRNKESITAEEKTSEFHEIMTVVFAEIAALQKHGFKWTFGKYTNTNEIRRIRIPFEVIIGDCAGAEEMCGRISSHLQTVKCLCRSCDVSYENGDIHSHVCQYHKMEAMMMKTEDELKEISYYNIPNPFYKHLSFGGDENGIFGCTPNEVLHQFDQGLCDYMCSIIYSQLSIKGRELLNMACQYICSSFSAQSERSFPSLMAFRNGFENTPKLTGKERFARITILYMILSCSDFVSYIIENKKQGCTYGIVHWQKIVFILEETMILHEALSLDCVRKDAFTIDATTSESKFQSRIRMYMKEILTYIPRSTKTNDHGWRIPKFHELLHIDRDIQRYGAPSNYNTSRPEYFGKVFGKETARRTQMRCLTLGQQSAERYCEFTVAKRVSQLTMLQIQKSIVSENIGNEGDIDSSAEGLCGSRFSFSHVENSFKWEKNNDTRWIAYDLETINALHSLLYKGEYGKVDQNYSVEGYTEYHKSGVIFRANPEYQCRSWFDYCYIKWGDNYEALARICMFIDLTNVRISYPEELSADDENALKPIPYVFIQSESDIPFEPTVNHLRLRLGKRVSLETGRRLVPLSSLSEPAFVKSNDIGMIEGNLPQYDNSIICYRPQSEWGGHFL